MESQQNPVPPTPTSQPTPQKTNGLALAGLILAFVVAPLGLIFSIIGLVKAKNYNGDGKTLSIIGIVASIIMSFITVFIMIGLVAATFSGIQQKAKEATQKTQTKASHYQALQSERLELGEAYTEASGIYSVTLPKGWEIIQSESGWYVSAGLRSQNGSYVSTTNISLDKLRASEDFNQYMTTETNKITKNDDIPLTSQAEVTINGLSGYELVATDTDGVLSSRYIVILNKADSIYRLEYRTSPEHTKAYLPTFKESARSFIVK